MSDDERPPDAVLRAMEDEPGPLPDAVASAWSGDFMASATAEQKAACQSVGTKQCAAICLSNLPTYAAGECPEAYQVWTARAIERERKRRPMGPLSSLVQP